MKIYYFKIHLLFYFCKCFTIVTVMFMVPQFVNLSNVINAQYANLIFNCETVVSVMGDVLPLKRQTVVDRLRVRFERYRWHHNSCVPRYERSAGALCDKQRQDTLRLKQRFLESKAKKAKSNKSDHHRAPVSTRESTADLQKFHSKSIKTVAEQSPVTTIAESSAQNVEQSGNGTRVEKASVETAAEKAQPAVSGFTLSLTPQFTNSNSHVQPPQTVNSENSSESTLQIVAANQICVSEKNHLVPTKAKADVQCKQEDGKISDLCELKSPTPSSISGDRLSDTFPSIGFAEDTDDDVIHPDILKHLIDDVFTNPGDIMKDFSFDDSVGSAKDGESNGVSESGKASASDSSLHKFNSDILMFGNNSDLSVPQQGSSLFGNHSSTASSVANPSLVTSSSINSAFCGSHQVQSAHCGVNSLHTSAPLAFKLTDPSPAALTLKQMAEQYQNVEQKQATGVNSTLSLMTQTQLDMDSLSGCVPTFRSRFLSGPTQQSQSSAAYHPYDSGYPRALPMLRNIFYQKAYRPNGHVVTMDQKQNLIQLPQHSFEKNHIPYDVAMKEYLYPGIESVATSQYLSAEDSGVNLQTGQNQHISSNCNPSPLHSGKKLETMQQTYTDLYAYNMLQDKRQMPSLAINDRSYNRSYSVHDAKAGQQLSQLKMHSAHMNCGNISVDETEIQSSSPYHHIMKHQASPLDQWSSVQQQAIPRNSIFAHQNNYENLNCGVAFSVNGNSSIISHTHRQNEIPLDQATSAKVIPPGHLILQEHNQQSVMQQHSGSVRLTSINNTVAVDNPTSQVYNCHQDTALSLDFLEHIDSSTSDLLNFDHVMQDAAKGGFELLDEMEMLSK